jgi:hypothetical protein
MVAGMHRGQLAWLHEGTRLPGCTFRDAEQQVNAQKKVKALMVAERKIWGARAVKPD